MADDVKKKDDTEASRQVSEDERFRYIGFEVYPGKPKDLFKNDAEREKFVESVREKRQRGHVIRDECTLLEDRLSLTDKLVLSLASVVVLAALFLPWFAVYNEIEEMTRVSQQAEAVADSAQDLPGEKITDTLGEAAVAAGAEAEPVTPEGEPVEAEPPAAEEPEGVGADPDEPDLAEVSAEPGVEGGEVLGTKRISESEEIIHGYVQRKKVYKEYTRVSAIGAIGVLGAAGSILFSSGIPLLLSTILMLIYMLACIGLPILTLYGLWGTKGTPDERALKLKRLLKLNWIPLIIFVVVLFLAFFGGDYSQPVGEQYGSLGDAYGIGVFLDVLSWGVIVTLAASVLVAAKGAEI